MSVELNPSSLPEASAEAVGRSIQRHTLLFRRHPGNPIITAAQWP